MQASRTLCEERDAASMQCGLTCSVLRMLAICDLNTAVDCAALGVRDGDEAGTCCECCGCDEEEEDERACTEPVGWWCESEAGAAEEGGWT